MGNEERQTALLTTSQREFLTGKKKDITDRGKRANRSNIRERTRHSLVDFHLLNEEIQRGDIEQIADAFDRIALQVAIGETVSFLYKLAKSHHGDIRPKEVIELGIDKAQEEETENLYRRFVQGDESLTLAELKLLEAEGYLERDQIVDVVEFAQPSPKQSPEEIADQL